MLRRDNFFPAIVGMVGRSEQQALLIAGRTFPQKKKNCWPHRMDRPPAVNTSLIPRIYNEIQV
jgi:hypothetical protein